MDRLVLSQKHANLYQSAQNNKCPGLFEDAGRTFRFPAMAVKRCFIVGSRIS